MKIKSTDDKYILFIVCKIINVDYIWCCCYCCSFVIFWHWNL